MKNQSLIVIANTSILAFASIFTMCCSSQIDYTVESRLFFQLPENYKDSSLSFSEDAVCYAYVVEEEEGEMVVVDGTAGEIFHRCSRVEFAPLTNRPFYWILDSSKISIVANNQIIPTEFTNERPIWFSPNGERWAIVGYTNTKEEDDQVQSIAVLVDGKEVGRYFDASDPTFSHDSKHCAFLTSNLISKNLIVDGEAVYEFKPGQAERSMEMTTFVQGPNMNMLNKVKYLSNGTLAILTQGEDGWTVYLDMTPVRAYAQNIWGGGSYQVITFSDFESSASIFSYSLTAASDAPYAIWWERLEGDEDRWRIVKNGEPVDDILSVDYGSSRKPVISANGEHVGYPAFIASSTPEISDMYAVIDGKKHGPYDIVWGMAFSKRGTVYTYAASQGEDALPWLYYKNGEPISEKYSSVYLPKITDDGKHIAWKAEKDEQKYLAVDGHNLEFEGEIVWGPNFIKKEAVWITQVGNEVLRNSVKLY